MAPDENQHSEPDVIREALGRAWEGMYGHVSENGREELEAATAALDRLVEQYGTLRAAVDDLIGHYRAEPDHEYRVRFWESFDRLREIGSNPASALNSDEDKRRWEDRSPANSPLDDATDEMWEVKGVSFQESSQS